MAQRILLEVCVESHEGAVAAERDGADRLELNSALAVGGLTPPLDLLRAVKQSTRIPVIAMLRPRGGDFCYSPAELAGMRRDLGRLLDAGADGLAFGILKPDDTIDAAACHDLLLGMRGMPAVLHRAFDEAASPFAALDEVIDLGFRRVLTSGQAEAAPEGEDLLRRLIERAAGRIEVLPGAGINSHNVLELLRVTGCDQVHGTFRQGVKAIRAILDRMHLKTK